MHVRLSGLFSLKRDNAKGLLSFFSGLSCLFGKNPLSLLVKATIAFHYRKKILMINQGNKSAAVQPDQKAQKVNSVDVDKKDADEGEPRQDNAGPDKKPEDAGKATETKGFAGMKAKEDALKAGRTSL